MDYVAEANRLIEKLRQRDTDPAFADAPILDTYARISRLAKEDDREKTERQTVDTLNKLLATDARLGRVLVDNNKSAWKRNGSRPAFRTMMDRLRAGKIQGVVVWHTDRLMRQPWDLETLIDEVVTRRVKRRQLVQLLSCFGDYTEWTTDQILQLRVTVAFAEKESADKSRRICRKAESLRESGQPNGLKGIFGHRYVHDTDVTDEQLTAERDAIVWGVNALIERIPLTAVARELNARGVTTRAGYPFTPQKARQTLYSGRHAGLVMAGDTKVATVKPLETLPEAWRAAGLSEAIVSEEKWDTLVAVMSTRKRGRPLAVDLHALTGSIFCAECGNRMGGEMHSSRYADGLQRRMYRCPPRGCNTNAIDARAAETWAAELVVAKMSDPRNHKVMARRSTQLSDVERDISAAREAQTAMSADLGAGLLTADAFRAFLTANAAYLSKLEAARHALVRAGAADVASPTDVAEMARRWEHATIVERKRIISAVFPNGFQASKRQPGVWSRGAAVTARLSVRTI